MIAEITRYRTADGKEHADRATAERHQNFLDILELINKKRGKLADSSYVVIMRLQEMGFAITHPDLKSATVPSTPEAGRF